MSLCHRRNTKTPPKLPSEFLSLCCHVIVSSTKYENTAETPLRVLVFMLSCHCVMEDTRKDRPPIFQTDLFILPSYVIDNERTDRRFSGPTFSFCCLMSSITKGPTADFPDRPFFLLSYVIDNERTDFRFSGPTVFFSCCVISSTTKGPTADFPDRPFTFAVLRYSRKISDGKFGEDRSHLIKQDTSR